MYIIGRIILGLVGLVIFIVIIVLLFGGHGPKKQPAKTTPVLMSLPDYADTTATVSMTTDGIVNGDELHRSIRVLVANNARELDIYQGYSGHVLNSQTFGNTLEAYTVFLKAINNTGFLAKNKTKFPTDERGQCPLGFRYILDLNQDNNDLSRTWSSSCDTGTAGGDIQTLLQLFQDQIPDYSTLTGQVNLEATSSSQ